MSETNTKEERNDGLRFYEVTVGVCGYNGGEETCKYFYLVDDFFSKPCWCLHPQFNRERARKVIHKDDYSGKTFPKYCPLSRVSRYGTKMTTKGLVEVGWTTLLALRFIGDFRIRKDRGFDQVSLEAYCKYAFEKALEKEGSDLCDLKIVVSRLIWGIRGYPYGEATFKWFEEVADEVIKKVEAERMKDTG